jgi:5-methylcytosine-specific restriction endonuclease McrA
MKRRCLGCGALIASGSRCAACRLRNGSTRSWRALRAQILLRDGYQCQIPGCDRAASHVDHRIPLLYGGSDDPSNLQALCAKHNLQKGADPPTAA